MASRSSSWQKQFTPNWARPQSQRQSTPYNITRGTTGGGGSFGRTTGSTIQTPQTTTRYDLSGNPVSVRTEDAHKYYSTPKDAEKARVAQKVEKLAQEKGFIQPKELTLAEQGRITFGLTGSNIRKYEAEVKALDAKSAKLNKERQAIESAKKNVSTEAQYNALVSRIEKYNSSVESFSKSVTKTKEKYYLINQQISKQERIAKEREADYQRKFATTIGVGKIDKTLAEKKWSEWTGSKEVGAFVGDVVAGGGELWKSGEKAGSTFLETLTPAKRTETVLIGGASPTETGFVSGYLDYAGAGVEKTADIIQPAFDIAVKPTYYVSKKFLDVAPESVYMPKIDLSYGTYDFSFGGSKQATAELTGELVGGFIVAPLVAEKAIKVGKFLKGKPEPLFASSFGELTETVKKAELIESKGIVRSRVLQGEKELSRLSESINVGSVPVGKRTPSRMRAFAEQLPKAELTDLPKDVEALLKQRQTPFVSREVSIGETAGVKGQEFSETVSVTRPVLSRGDIARVEFKGGAFVEAGKGLDVVSLEANIEKFAFKDIPRTGFEFAENLPSLKVKIKQDVSKFVERLGFEKEIRAFERWKAERMVKKEIEQIGGYELESFQLTGEYGTPLFKRTEPISKKGLLKSKFFKEFEHVSETGKISMFKSYGEKKFFDYYSSPYFEILEKSLKKEKILGSTGVRTKGQHIIKLDIDLPKAGKFEYTKKGVLKHELLHQKYPLAPEKQIRQFVRDEPFPKYEPALDFKVVRKKGKAPVSKPFELDYFIKGTPTDVGLSYEAAYKASKKTFIELPKGKFRAFGEKIGKKLPLPKKFKKFYKSRTRVPLTQVAVSDVKGLVLDTKFKGFEVESLEKGGKAVLVQKIKTKQVYPSLSVSAEKSLKASSRAAEKALKSQARAVQKSIMKAVKPIKPVAVTRQVKKIKTRYQFRTPKKQVFLETDTEIVPIQRIKQGLVSVPKKEQKFEIFKISKTKPDFDVGTLEVPETVFEPFSVTRTRQDIALKEESLEKLKPLTTTVAKTATSLKPLTVPKLKPIEISKKIRLPLLMPSKKEKKLKAVLRTKKTKGYIPQVKSRGKWLKASEKPLSKNSALSLGANIVDNTTSQSFRIKKSKKKVKQPLLDSAPDLTKFYHKGNRFIEKPKAKIDSLGEIWGIPYEGVKKLKKYPELRLKKSKRRAKKWTGLL